MRRAVLGKTHYELGRKMCRISRAPTIPANEQFVPGAQTLLDQIGGLCDLEFKCLQRLKRPGRIVNHPIQD
jgi:hypothetical protein